MIIYVDADACPVVDETVRIATAHEAECVLLSDTAHVMNRPGARTITVSQGADSVDFVLVNLLRPGDVVITQDYGLAAMCLARCARVLNQDGSQYTNDNIGGLLMRRHTARKIRMGGGRTKGPKKRTQAQNLAFEHALNALLDGEA